MFRKYFAAAALTLAAVAAPLAAQADTIAFEGLSGGPLALFTGPYEEVGFSVERTAGTIRENFLIGNPYKGLMATRGASTFELTAIDGSLFTFAGFDIAATVNGGTYSVFGDDALTPFLTGSYSDSIFAPISSGTKDAFSKLTFQFLTPGILNTLRIDNIEVTAVPEPTTWAMMMLGLGGIGFAMRRRRSPATLAPAHATA